MARRANPTAIGIFVVASFAILVAAVIVLGSGRLFRRPARFVCMFAGDLNGLRVGAPVKFRGVQIGSVVAIKLALSPSEGRLLPDLKTMRLPVIIELDRSQLTARGGNVEVLRPGALHQAIERGLRAQLKIESFLTGLLYVDLDIHPHTPIDLALEPGGSLREIPTVPANLEALQQELKRALAKLERIDFPALAASITNAANAIKTVAGSPSLRETLVSLRKTTVNLNRAVIAIRTAVNHANARIDPLVTSLKQSSERAGSALQQTQATLASLNLALDPASPVMVHLNQALVQLSETMRSVNELADYLQRNPAALVRGKYAPDNAR